MKTNITVLIVCVTFLNSLLFATEQDYLRLKSGRYEYSLQQTLSSNYVSGFNGGCFSFACELTIQNTTNISVHIDKITASSAVGFVGGKEQLEKQNKQVLGETAVFNINSSDNSLVLKKTYNKTSDDFFVQVGDILMVPLPKKLSDGMFWTNSASRFFLFQKQILSSHNGSNDTFCIKSIEKTCENEQDDTPELFDGDVYIVVDKQSEQIILSTFTMKLSKNQTTKFALKFMGDAQEKQVVKKY